MLPSRMTTAFLPSVFNPIAPNPDPTSLASDRTALLRMSPQGFQFRPPPPPHKLTTFITEDDALFQTMHMGSAVIDPTLWRLRLEGEVENPLTLTLTELHALPQTDVTAFHECYGSPLAPPQTTFPQAGAFVRRIGNVRWTGVRLSTLLDLARPHAGAKFVWSDGLDAGTFAGVEAERYRKDLPLAKAYAPEVLVAVAMNGAPLSPERGGPVRLVVPGWFGTNSTKWLCRLRVEGTRASGPFTTRFYNEKIPGDPNGGLKPVWEVEPSSMIVGPEPGAVVEGSRVEVWGRAWSGDGIEEVRVMVDGKGEWLKADLAERVEFEWQRFSVEITGLEPGIHSFTACATSKTGMSQPLTGRRNHVHTVHIIVR